MTERPIRNSGGRGDSRWSVRLRVRRLELAASMWGVAVLCVCWMFVMGTGSVSLAGLVLMTLEIVRGR